VWLCNGGCNLKKGNLGRGRGNFWRGKFGECRGAIWRASLSYLGGGCRRLGCFYFITFVSSFLYPKKSVV